MKAVFRFPAVRPELPPPEAWRPAIERAYAANWFTNFGALSRQLEDRFQQTWGFEDTACVAAASATSGLAAALIAADVSGPVLLPAFTFPATLSAVRMSGAAPRLVDADAKTWRASLSALSDALEEPRARAVVLVAPFGLQCDFSAEIALARAAGASVVIDNAAGVGGARRPVESDPAVMEVVSLHATKPYGAGEGGMIFAHRDRVSALRRALNFGLPYEEGGQGPAWGINGKMSEFHAAVGLAAEESYPHRLRLRRGLVARYQDALADRSELVYPIDPMAACWQYFPVLAATEAAAAAAQERAMAADVEVRRMYLPALTALVAGAGPCPAAEDLAARMCAYPVYSYRTEEEEDHLLRVLRAAFVP